MGYRWLRALLFRLPPETAHHFTLQLLKLAYRPALVKFLQRRASRQGVSLWGLSFPNRVGLAAGLDKNGDYIDALFGLGFGFIEVGCVTPKPQAGNPGPRVFRLPKAQALINRMGFNNKGVDYLVARLRARKVPGIVGVNIGKNRDTSLEDAVKDYLICLERVYPYADFVTVNISSPNTPGLRELASQDFLEKLLSALQLKSRELSLETNRVVPLLIKITVDFTDAQLQAIVALALQYAVDGIICSNTTVDHSSVAQYPNGSEQGGLSGPMLRVPVTQMIAKIRDLSQNKLPVIGVGGIMNAPDAKAHLQAGASLVQLYTGLIYQGPQLVRECIVNSNPS